MDDLDDLDDLDREVAEYRRGPLAWLRRRGLAHFVPKDFKDPKSKRSQISFLENLVLAGTRDVAARHGQADVSMLEVFQEISAGLRKNYRGPNFVFDFSEFEKSATALAVKPRRWVAMRQATNRRLSPTIRLTEAGAKIAATLPAVGMPMTPEQLAECSEATATKRPSNSKPSQAGQQHQVTMADLGRAILDAFKKAIEAEKKKQDPTAATEAGPVPATGPPG